MTEKFDVVVIGAGAAGLMCAIEAGKRGRSVLLVDHAKAPGEKIRISGGGRCNFTNLDVQPKNFISGNPHFALSALRRYTQHDFIALVDRHNIAWHEKTLGQLFCDGSSRQIVDMLVQELREAGGRLASISRQRWAVSSALRW
jgi:predicted flavoprotein YhiN